MTAPLSPLLLAGFSWFLPSADAPVQPEVAAPVVQEADEAPEEPKTVKWEGSIDAGFTKTSGNTDTTTIALNLDAKRESETDRYTFKGYYNKDEDDGDTTANQIGALFQYDYFLNEKWYLYGNTGGEHDELADLDLRYTVGVGAGYQFRKDEKIELSAEAGLSYVDENYDADDADADYLAARLAGHYQNVLREGVVFGSDAAAYPSLEDRDDFTGRWDNRLRVSLTDNMYTQFQVVWDYDKSPADDNDRLDSRYVVTLGWAF